MLKCTGILFGLLLLIFTPGISQIKPIFVLEYSVNASIINDYPRYPDSKTGHHFGLRVDFPVSDISDFTLSIGILNTGTKRDVVVRKEVRHFNYFTISAGPKFHFKKFFIAPEMGTGIFLYHSIDYYEMDDKVRDDVYFSKNIGNQIRARSSVIFTGLSFGLEFDLNKNVLLFGSKNYFFLQPFADRNNGDKYFPVGLGLYIAFVFGKR